MKCSNVTECSCPNNHCENHGKCCACIKRHRDAGNLPNCLRIPIAPTSATQETE